MTSGRLGPIIAALDDEIGRLREQLRQLEEARRLLTNTPAPMGASHHQRPPAGQAAQLPNYLRAEGPAGPTPIAAALGWEAGHVSAAASQLARAGLIRKTRAGRTITYHPADDELGAS